MVQMCWDERRRSESRPASDARWAVRMVLEQRLSWAESLQSFFAPTALQAWTRGNNQVTLWEVPRGVVSDGDSVHEATKELVATRKATFLSFRHFGARGLLPGACGRQLAAGGIPVPVVSGDECRQPNGSPSLGRKVAAE